MPVLLGIMERLPQDKEEYVDAAAAGTNLELTKEMTEDMLDALAGCLKEKA